MAKRTKNSIGLNSLTLMDSRTANCRRSRHLGPLNAKFDEINFGGGKVLSWQTGHRATLAEMLDEQCLNGDRIVIWTRKGSPLSIHRVKQNQFGYD